MKRLQNNLWRVVVILVVLMGMAPVCRAEGEAEKSATKTLSPYFFIERGEGAADHLPLKATNVKVQITGVIADVVVTQEYKNEGTVPINARYIFPGSTRAAVQGMKMTLGEKVITAKIKEKEIAQKQFDEAKKEGKSASLLSQNRPNVFSMSVANIMPGDVVAIELRYTELLVPTDGIYEFVYPTVVGPRYSNQSEEGAAQDDQWVKNPYLRQGQAVQTRFDISSRLSTGMDLQDLTCLSHDTRIDFEGPALAEVRLKEPEVFSGDRDYILRYRLADSKIQTGLMLYQGEDENFFLLTVQPPQKVQSADIPPREYIFLVDVSGSMHGFPLEVSKELLKNLIGALRPSDLFNVVLFAGGSRLLNDVSLPATQSNIDRAIRLINDQNGGGGTELLSAMNTALQIPRDKAFSRSLVMVTDGYIDAEKAVFDLLHDNLATTNVFAFGIGSSVNRYLIEGVARAGMGEPFIVTEASEAARVAKRFCNYIQAPVLKDIALTFEGFAAYDLEPDVFPDLFAERPLVVIGKYRGEATGRIKLVGNSAQGPFAQEFQVAENAPLAEHQALRALWARTRLSRLSDYAASRQEEMNREAITALGLQYGLLSKYTSFLAVHEVVRNPQGNAQDVKQPLPLPQGVSELAVGNGLSNVPEPELELLVVLLALFAAALAARSKRLGLRI